jgi:hypothetical protein
LFLGGQHTPILGGQYAPIWGGHFNPFLGGQFERFFQPDFFFLLLSRTNLTVAIAQIIVLPV